MARSETAALPIGATPTRRAKQDLMTQQRRWGWIFISPWIIGFVIFTAAPIIFSLMFTFTDFNLADPDKIKFIGLQNWGRIFTDPDNLQAMSVTLRFMALAIPFGIILPIALASLLNSKHMRARRFWTTVFYMPYVVPAVSSTFVWKAFLNG